MSLDVTLSGEPFEKDCFCTNCLSSHKTTTSEEFYSANITHNLTRMAEAAGIYKAMWRPEEIGAKKAKDIIGLLEKGLSDLESRPEHFEQFNASNGWGMYKHFVPFVREYLRACKEFPDANIHVSR